MLLLRGIVFTLRGYIVFTRNEKRKVRNEPGSLAERQQSLEFRPIKHVGSETLIQRREVAQIIYTKHSSYAKLYSYKVTIGPSSANCFFCDRESI